MEDIEYMKEEAEHKVLNAFSTLMKGITTAASVGALFRVFNARRYIDTASMLRRLGLSRRRSFAGSFALVGLGVLAGAGLAAFASPQSGRDTRQGLLRGYRNLRRKGRELFESAGTQVGEIAEGKEREGKERESRREQRGERVGEAIARQGSGPSAISGGPSGYQGGTPGTSGSARPGT